MQSSNARDERNALLLEVKAMIRMKMPPKTIGQNGGDIPKFAPLGGALIKDDDSGDALAYDEGLVNGQWPVFLLSTSAKIGRWKLLMHNYCLQT